MIKRAEDNVEMAVRRKSPLRGKLIGLRLQPDELKAIDTWANKQRPPVTRPEAIRSMINVFWKTISKREIEELTKKSKRR